MKYKIDLTREELELLFLSFGLAIGSAFWHKDLEFAKRIYEFSQAVSERKEQID